MQKIIVVRKLVAVDMAWIGTRFILIEYAVGVVLPLLLGLLTLRTALAATSPPVGQVLLGVWLIGIATNYVPLFLYAVSLARSGSVKAEGLPEMRNARRYGTQQVMILVPLMVVILAIIQEASRPKPPN